MTEPLVEKKKGVFPYFAFVFKLVMYLAFLAMTIIFCINLYGTQETTTGNMLIALFPVATALIFAICVYLEVKQLKDWRQL